MPPLRRPPAKSHKGQKVLSQLTRLSIDAPQVIAHRLGRMARSGPLPSAADQREFVGMVMEKPLAFAKAWQAMFDAGTQAQRHWLAHWSQAWLKPGALGPGQTAHALRKAQEAGLDMISRGLEPIERKAAANAKRLARSRRG